MASHDQEKRGGTPWLSPLESKDLLDEYCAFLGHFERQFKEILETKKETKDIKKLIDWFVNKNLSWTAKLTFCDPDLFENFMDEREDYERAKRFNELSLEAKPLILESDSWLERIQRENKQEE